ncbi:hypothetical protein VHUM_01926 [Vanrija humicola]|uniref:Transcription factor domain-containing protein n=1 Tax=Vanrija humicola TaxID=5417 RepID=A0A7D8Z0F0_VANHU|nr:hypothetical protein VHUM_01926 [Vanrija humicola]
MTRWGRPSVWSLWGLSCLVPYSIATAGPAETDFLLDRMVMHVRELGIHQRGTAALYPEEDMVGLLFSAFFYMDTWVRLHGRFADSQDVRRSYDASAKVDFLRA